MSSRKFGRITIAATIGVCVYSQTLLPAATMAQGAPPVDIPGAPSGQSPASASGTATPQAPSPVVPTSSSILTPEVSAILNQSAPSPTTMVIDFAQQSTLHFAGDFINPANVTLYAISTDPNITTATISAANIYNAGIITTILPSCGLPGYTNLVGNLNLVMNAVNNIVNIGEISSAGNLSLTAGNAIANITSNAGLSAIMSAANNFSLAANTIVNSGTINAMNNLNLASVMANNLAVNAVGGVFQAGGAINIRDAAFTSKSNLDVLGGIWYSPTLNFYSGNGITKMTLESATGVINGSTGELYVSSVATLNLGNIEILGDPVFSSEGDLFLGSISANEAISAFANANIFAGSLVANGGAITLQAGGLISASGSLQTTHSIYIVGSTVSAAGTEMSAGDFVQIGGNVIDVSGATITAGTSVDFFPTTLTANGVQITAGGSVSVTGNEIGSVSLNQALIQSGGNVSIGSGEISAVETSLTATGQIYLGASLGNITAESLQVTANNNVTIDALNGGVDLSGSIIKSNGGNVFVYGGQTVNLGELLDSSGSSGGGRVFVASANGSIIAPVEGFITTGPNPIAPPPGFFDISINARESLSVGHLISGGGNISVQSGSVSERQGGAVLALVTQEGAGSTSVTEINSAGAFTTRGDIEVFGALGGIQAGSITGNGMSVLVDSRGELSVESINNDIVDDRGGFNTIRIVANANSPLLIEDGAISANGLTGGGLVQITSNGSGGLLIKAGGISVAATDSGSGGTIFASSASWLTVNGDIVVDGKGNGAGGIVELTALDGNLEVTGKLSANGEGAGYSGGRIVLSSFAGDVTVGGSSITVNGAEGDGGGFGASAFGAITLPSVEANGGGEAGHGGNMNISSTSFDNVSLTLSANGSGSGNGGTIRVQSDENFDARSGVSISAHGGEAGNGGNLLLSSGQDLLVESSDWDLSAGTNGNGGSVVLRAGESGAVSTLSVTGRINVDGNGAGNGGYIEIAALGEGTDLTIGAGGDATVLSARSGTAGGDGGAINVTSGGNLSVNGPSLRVYARGEDGNGGSISLTAGGAGGGVIGAAALSFGTSSSSSAPAMLTVNGRLSTNGAGTGDGGTITLAAQGSQGVIQVNESSLLTATGSNGGTITATAGKDLSINSVINASSTRNGGNGGIIELTSGLETGGVLNVNGDLRANGNGEGVGGTIALASFSSPGEGEGAPGIGGRILLADRADLRARGKAGGRIEVTSTNMDGGTLFDVSSTGQGSGGEISISSSSIFLTGDLLANGKGIGDGGTINLQVSGLAPEDSGVTFDGGGQSLRVQALGGGDEGKGGLITITSSGRIDAADTNFSVSAKGLGDAGLIQLESEGAIATGSLKAVAEAEGNGGQIFLHSGTDSALSVGNSQTLNGTAIDVSGGENGGNGGSITLISGSSVTISGDVLAESNSSNGNAGSIMLTAGMGASGPANGVPQVFGSLFATAARGDNGESGTAGKITINYSSNAAINIGKSGRGSLGGFIDNVFATAGDNTQGGTITFENKSAAPLALNMVGGSIVTKNVPSASSGSKVQDNMGLIKLNQNFADQSVTISGTGTVRGNIETKASTIKIHVDGKNTVLGLSNLVATSQGSPNVPSISISAIGANSFVSFQSMTPGGESNISAGKDLLVRSDRVLFNDDTKIVLGNGGRGNIESARDNGAMNVEFSNANVHVSTTHENASEANLPHSTFTIGSSDHKGQLNLGLEAGATSGQLELVDASLGVYNHGNLNTGSGLAILVDGGAGAPAGPDGASDIITLNTVNGNIQINGPILAGLSDERFASSQGSGNVPRIRVSSAKGDILLAGAILGQNPQAAPIPGGGLEIRLETGGAGSISQAAGSSVAIGESDGTLYIKTNNRDIGSLQNPINIVGADVKLYLDQQNANTPNKDVYLSYDGASLTVRSEHSAPTRTGNLHLSSSTPCESCTLFFEFESDFYARSMEVRNFGNVDINGDIHITNGDIFINATNHIGLGDGVTMKADGPRGLGNVSLVVGTLSVAAGTKLSSVTTVEQGAKIYWGNGITVNGGATVKALRANVVFSAPNASAITLGDRVTIIADPPEELSEAPASQMVQLAPSAKVDPVNLQLPVFGPPVLDGSIASKFQLSATQFSRNDGATVKPRAPEQKALPPGDGEALLYSPEKTSISFTFGQVRIPANMAVVVKRQGSKIELLCLHNPNHASIEFSGPQSYKLEAGEALLVADQERASFSVPVRQVRTRAASGCYISTAEFSLVTALSSKSPYLQMQKRLKERVLKNAAALSIVTQSHGGFRSPE
ncbi:MAG: hypothetical protein K2W95_10570 [Candidatus Obscuribacterales bacterium]|nr:hypothetical protein [Candidatus Obscuribacterales bacterium]